MQNGAPHTPPPTDSSSKSDGKLAAVPDLPLTSTDDDGTSKRPRDARLLHVVLHNLGVQSYQERVPLQLLDFAYRYTSSVLSDALRLSAEGYSGQGTERKRGGGAAAANDDASGITVTALRQAIASRQGYAFETALPKEFMLEQAAERNRIALPKVERGYGLQLPEEKYCLTGVGWGLKDVLEDESDVAAAVPTANGIKVEVGQEDTQMSGLDASQEYGDDDDGAVEDGAGKLEDVFGEEQEVDVSMTGS